jgi:hypothetical protein
VITLPEWIKNESDPWHLKDEPGCPKCKLIEALAIAWETLAKFASEDYRGNRPMHIAESWHTMRRIEELGK